MTIIWTQIGRTVSISHSSSLSLSLSITITLQNINIMSSKQNKKGSLAIAGVLVAADKTLAYNGHNLDEVSHTDKRFISGIFF